MKFLMILNFFIAHISIAANLPSKKDVLEHPTLLNNIKRTYTKVLGCFEGSSTKKIDIDILNSKFNKNKYESLQQLAHRVAIAYEIDFVGDIKLGDKTYSFIHYLGEGKDAVASLTKDENKELFVVKRYGPWKREEQMKKHFADLKKIEELAKKDIYKRPYKITFQYPELFFHNKVATTLAPYFYSINLNELLGELSLLSEQEKEFLKSYLRMKEDRFLLKYSAYWQRSVLLMNILLDINTLDLVIIDPD